MQSWGGAEFSHVHSRHRRRGQPAADVRERTGGLRDAPAGAALPGSSAVAYATGVKRADVYLSVSFRPILRATMELAWEREHAILGRISPHRFFGDRGGAAPATIGSQRPLAAAATRDLHDRALWTAIAKAGGGVGDSTALVGTPDTVAQALLDCHDLGVTTF